jgi:hypothetical protein
MVSIVMKEMNPIVVSGQYLRQINTTIEIATDPEIQLATTFPSLSNYFWFTYLKKVTLSL